MTLQRAIERAEMMLETTINDVDVTAIQILIDYAKQNETELIEVLNKQGEVIGITEKEYKESLENIEER